MVLDLPDCEEYTSERMDTKIHIIHNVYLLYKFMCVCSGKVNSLIHIKIYIIRSRNYKYEQEFFSRMFVTAKKLEFLPVL